MLKEREKKAEEKERKEEERAKKSRAGATNKTAARAHPSRSGSEELQPKWILRDCRNLSVAQQLRGDTQDTDSNKCCVCLQSFEEDVELGFGVQWIQCACERWLHEDCVIDVITDSSGKERLCPFCT